MRQDGPRAIVMAWQQGANAGDIDRLLVLADAEIEIVGPRGSGRGHQLLRDWLGRAGLTLETRRVFAHDDTVVVTQRGVWRAPDSGAVAGAADVASVFRVADALAATGLSEADEVQTG